MLGSFCETNHASNARKNQHKREIATALHVLVGAPFCERDSVVPSDGVFISGHALENPKNAPLCLTFSQARDAFSGGDRTSHLDFLPRLPIWKALSRRAKKRRGARAPENTRQFLPMFTTLGELLLRLPTCPALDVSQLPELFHVRGRDPLPGPDCRLQVFESVKRTRPRPKSLGAHE
jgi:hypothetical protein